MSTSHLQLIHKSTLTTNTNPHLDGKSTDIYFKQNNADEHHAALQLRDAVLRLRRDGAFVAVPLFRVNTEPIGPHTAGAHFFCNSWLFCVSDGVYVGSYEIWVPTMSFAPVFSYLCMNRGILRYAFPSECIRRICTEYACIAFSYTL